MPDPNATPAAHADDLTERYLAAVAGHLPKAQREEVLAELADAVASRVEARAEELGRALTGDELADELKAMGHPLRVAGRYLPVQQLVGPTVLPLWWLGVKVALVVIGALHAGTALLALAQGAQPLAALLRALSDTLHTGLWAVGLLTLIAAAAEQRGARSDLLRDWQPRKLAPARDRWRIKAGDPITDGVTAAVLLLWWVGALKLPSLVWHDGEPLAMLLSPAWATLAWPVVLLCLWDIALAGLNLARPRWTRPRLLVQGLNHLAWIAALGWLLRAEAPLVLPGVAELAPGALRIVSLIDTGVRGVLLVMALITLAELLAVLWKLARGPGQPSAGRAWAQATPVAR